MLKLLAGFCREGMSGLGLVSSSPLDCGSLALLDPILSLLSCNSCSGRHASVALVTHTEASLGVPFELVEALETRPSSSLERNVRFYSFGKPKPLRETEAEVWDVTFSYDPDRSLNMLFVFVFNS